MYLSKCISPTIVSLFLLMIVVINADENGSPPTTRDQSLGAEDAYQQKPSDASTIGQSLAAREDHSQDAEAPKSRHNSSEWAESETIHKRQPRASHPGAAPSKERYLRHRQKLQLLKQGSGENLASKSPEKRRRLFKRLRNKTVLQYHRRKQFLKGLNPKHKHFRKNGPNNTGHKFSTRSRKGVNFTPLGMAAPVGPIQNDKLLEKKYGKYFTEDDDETNFTLPKDLPENCWVQAMRSHLFSPNCNDDGTYSSKQCHKKRCWCSDKHGKQAKHSGGNHNDGFFFGIKALTLRCV